VVHANVTDRVIDWLPDGKHLLLALPVNEFSMERAVYKVDVDTGKRRLYQNTRAQVYDWMTDADYRVRIAVESDDDAGEYAIWVCDPSGSNWRMLRRFGMLDGKFLWPLGFGKDPQQLYLLANHNGLRAVHTLDLRDPRAEPKVLHAHPSRDLDGVLVRDRTSGEAVGLRVYGTEEAQAEYWDLRYQALQQGLDKALPGRDNEVVQMLDDGSTYLARTSGNGIPLQYLLGDRVKGSATLLA